MNTSDIQIVDQDGQGMDQLSITEMENPPLQEEPGTLIINDGDDKIEKDFPAVEERFDETEAQRKIVADKMFNIIKEMPLDLNDTSKGASRINEVKLQAINTWAGLTKDRDGQAVTLAKLKLAKEQNATETANAKLISQFLYQFKPVPVENSSIDLREADDIIEQRFEALGDPIKEGELE